MKRTTKICAVVFWLAVSLGGAPSVAEDATTAEESKSADASSLDALEKTLTSLIRDALPSKYENEKQWGMTKQVFDGLKVEREGWKIETRRRRKPVNHGTWKRYEVTLVDPDEHFQLDLHDVSEIGDGRYRFDVVCSAKLHVFGRLSQWERGVQLISLSADATADARLRIVGTVGMKVDPFKLPPDISLDPKVTEASLELTKFRLNRVSELHGPLAKHLGEGLREVIDDKVDDVNRTLAAKLNQQIDKKRPKLKLSLQDALTSKWNKWIKSPSAATTPVTKSPATAEKR